MAAVRLQRGFVLGIWGYVVAAIAILGMIGALIWWADSNIATSAGVKKGEAKVRAEWAEANAQAREDERQRSVNAALSLSGDRAKARTIIQTRTVHVDREVEKIVYRSICLPDSGLCLARAAILGTLAPGCKPDGTMPASKPSG